MPRRRRRARGEHFDVVERRRRAMPAAAVRDQADAEHARAEVAGRDRLEHRRHADEIGAERAQHPDLGGRLVRAAEQPRVHAFGQRRDRPAARAPAARGRTPR